MAHALGEVVGLGLRNLAHCPVELNLMPESTLNWVQFNQKKPYFIATVFSLVLVVFASELFVQQAGVGQPGGVDKLNRRSSQPMQEEAEKFKKDSGGNEEVATGGRAIRQLVQDRYYWADVLTELHRVMIAVEAGTGANFVPPPAYGLKGSFPPR